MNVLQVLERLLVEFIKNMKLNQTMAMFGKTIGNGYALTAVVGKKSVMEAAQNTFISSTFWTERIGPTAAKGDKSNGT